MTTEQAAASVLTGRSWVLEFDGIPPGPNTRMSWQEENRVAKRWRTAGWAMANNAEIPRLQRARISAVFFRRNLGVADVDNDTARLKHVLDGVKDVCLPDDNRRYLELGTITEERGPRGLRLVIEECA